MLRKCEKCIAPLTCAIKAAFLDNAQINRTSCHLKCTVKFVSRTEKILFILLICEVRNSDVKARVDPSRLRTSAILSSSQ